MSIELIRSEKLSGIAQYAYAATAPHDARFIFLAGSCPLDPDGNTVGLHDYARQAETCLNNLEEALRAAGAQLTDVISTRVLVASSAQRELVTAWNVVATRFGSHDVPSTLMGVTALGYDGQLVKIEAVAAVVDEV